MLINESINELLENVNFNETNGDGKMEKRKGISSRINLKKGCFNTKEQVSKKCNPRVNVQGQKPKITQYDFKMSVSQTITLPRHKASFRFHRLPVPFLVVLFDC